MLATEARLNLSFANVDQHRSTRLRWTDLILPLQKACTNVLLTESDAAGPIVRHLVQLGCCHLFELRKRRDA